jgi:DedD protein
MDFAFWRRNKRLPGVAKHAATRSPTSTEPDALGRAEPAAALRARARRRLIGAAALLLAVAIVVPMLLDPEPRPVPDNIAIDIPSEKTPFTPRLSLPPVPAEPADEPAPPAIAATPVAPPVVAAPPKRSADTARPVEPRKAPTVDNADEQRARALLEGKKLVATAAPTKSGAFAVQAAATASEAAAKELAERLRKAGLSPYIEKVETKAGTRHRVRVGPYATRVEAERSQERLKALGIGANLVTL